MALRNLLLHVDGSAHYPPRLEAAVSLAAAHGARITALYGEAPDPAAGEDVEKGSAWHCAAQRAAESFRARAEACGVECEWRVPSRELPDPVLAYARCYQLVVLGKPDPDGPAPEDAEGLAARVILNSGRPVFVVPRTGLRRALDNRVLVAWDASRAATRALHDAMPLLEEAGRVSLLSVDPPGGPAEEEINFEMRRALERRGVEAALDRSFADPRMGLADELLSRAADGRFDLLVIGVQRQHRLGEVALSEETTKLLRTLTLPVLFSA